jgi:hypothetical protein
MSPSRPRPRRPRFARIGDHPHPGPSPSPICQNRGSSCSTIEPTKGQSCLARDHVIEPARPSDALPGIGSLVRYCSELANQALQQSSQLTFEARQWPMTPLTTAAPAGDSDTGSETRSHDDEVGTRTLQAPSSQRNRAFWRMILALPLSPSCQCRIRICAPSSPEKTAIGV